MNGCVTSQRKDFEEAVTAALRTAQIEWREAMAAELGERDVVWEISTGGIGGMGEIHGRYGEAVLEYM